MEWDGGVGWEGDCAHGHRVCVIPIVELDDWRFRINDGFRCLARIWCRD